MLWWAQTWFLSLKICQTFPIFFISTDIWTKKSCLYSIGTNYFKFSSKYNLKVVPRKKRNQTRWCIDNSGTEFYFCLGYKLRFISVSSSEFLGMKINKITQMSLSGIAIAADFCTEQGQLLWNTIAILERYILNSNISTISLLLNRSTSFIC